MLKCRVMFDDAALPTAGAARAEWRAEEAEWSRAALERWETDYTDTIIDQLMDIDDPRARFRALLESAFREHPGVLIDANLLAHTDDPAVGAALDLVEFVGRDQHAYALGPEVRHQGAHERPPRWRESR